jgi:hypothetical protein
MCTGYRSIANRSSFHGRFARNSDAATAKGAQAQTCLRLGSMMLSKEKKKKYAAQRQETSSHINA